MHRNGLVIASLFIPLVSVAGSLSEVPPSVGPVRLQRKRTSTRLFQAGVLVG